MLAKTAAINVMTGPLVIGDFSHTTAVTVSSSGSSNFNQFHHRQRAWVFVNGNGTFNVSGPTAATTQAITTLDVRGGSIITGTNTLQTNNTITGIADGTAGLISGKLALAAATTINVVDDDQSATVAVPGLTISAVISGAFALTKGGPGTLILDGTAANTYTGLTTVNAGTLDLGDTGGVAVPAGLTIGDGYGNSSATYAPVQTLSVGGTLSGGSFTLSFNGDTTGTISGSTLSAATIQSALAGLANVGANNVSVTGTGPYTITFASTVTNPNVITVATSTLTASSGIAVGHSDLRRPQHGGRGEPVRSRANLDTRRQHDRRVIRLDGG